MIQQSGLRTNYSSQVELYLVVGDRSWELASIGPDYITLRGEGIELDQCHAEIVLCVDGKERRWDVVLKSGAVPFERTIPITESVDI